MNKTLTFFAIVTGTAIGTFLFFVTASYFLGDPFGDWLLSAHGIVIKSQAGTPTEAELVQIERFLQKGLIVTPEGVIGSITTLYGNLIQVLIGILAIFGITSFLAVRWKSIQATEEFVDGKIEKKFSSHEFQKLLDESTTNAVDLYSTENDEITREVHRLRSEMDELTTHLSKSAPEDEPEEETAES